MIFTVLDIVIILILITWLFFLNSQVTQQMLRSRAGIGYGSNPSSPNVPGNGPNQFAFPPQRAIDSEEAGTSGSIRPNGDSSSPGRSGGVS